MADKASTPPTLRTRPPPWLDLPSPLTEQILEGLPLPDYLRFPLVCRAWRSIQGDHRLRHAAPMPPFPFLIKFPTTCHRHRLQYSITCYSPSEQRSYRFQIPGGKRLYATSHGWMILVNNQNLPPFSFLLLNPVSGIKIHLPLLEEITPRSISLSSPPDDPNSIILFAGRSRSRFLSQVFLWRAADPDHWTKSDTEVSICISIFCKGKFYCYCDFGQQLCIIDPLPNPTVQWCYMQGRPYDSGLCYMNRTSYCSSLHFFAESDGDVLLVRPTDRKKEKDCYFDYVVDGFNVYKADLSRKEWVRVESLGRHRAIFIGPDCSVSLLATDIEGCRENCIYFPSRLIDCGRKDDTILWKVFDMKTRRIIDGLPPPNTTIGYSGHDEELIWIVPRL